MELIVKVNRMEDIALLDQADAFLLAHEDFSLRYEHSFSLEEIKQLKRASSQKIYILMNKIFMEEELSNAESFLKELQELDVDGIFFSDFSIFMAAKKIHFEERLFFYHETFLRNSYDIKMYQQIGIKKVICSKDMCLDDIMNLDGKNKTDYGIVCFGYMPIYYSKRKILSSFIQKNAIDTENLDRFHLFLKEEKRESFYPVLEQKHETTIFQNEILSYADQLPLLQKRIHYFLIDSLFFSSSFIKELITILKDDDQNKQERIRRLHPDYTYTIGFLYQKAGYLL